MARISYLIPKPSSEGGMTAISQMFYRINYFDNIQNYHFNTSFKAKNKLARLFEALFRIPLFIKHLVEVKPDAVFVMSSSYLGFYEKCLYCLIARVFGAKSMLNHVGGEFDKFYHKTLLNRFLIRNTIKFPNVLLIGSSYWCNYFRNLFPKVTVYNVPNPIIADDYNNSVSGDENGKFVVVSLFRLVKEKGVIELIAVIKAMCSMYKNIHFVIIGDGPMLGYLNAELEAYIDQGFVKVLGFVDEVTKIEEITKANAYLMLTYFDLMPISIMEAMAASKPVLSTRVGGIPDLVLDGVNGFLFDIGETKEVVSKLSLFIEDQGLAREMGRKGRERIDKFFNISKVTALHQKVATELNTV